MKTTTILFAAALLVGCTSDNIRSEPAVATITDVFEDKSPMGCMGTDWNTIIRLDDQRVGRLCGRFGKPGDKVRGCWETGHRNGIADGFRTVCSKAGA